ncbi:SH3 domain-containing protein [Phormidium sp. CCY1219]|uniref:SH3 domain-containing protein n=1 Tax=Phormidium sp. CCY1219 TaxID=2886104 RepID=UPI002D1EF177|nr:SH3 domain-containing protein [Phormidium sp. CCY1219]MEB3831329.1 SH3 domain-containing protein [Phormidium sp. CCY1219]
MLRHWSVTTVSLTAFAIAIAGFPRTTPGAIASLSATSTLAQANSLCRRVTEARGLAIRQRPDPNSPQISGVDPNGFLTLASDAREIPGPDGRVWLEISEPVPGYVSNGEPGSAGNLAPCTGSARVAPQPNRQPTNVTTNMCRRISPDIAPQGITVHTEASRFSTNRGGLPPGGRVLLVPNSGLIQDRNREARTWVQISSPVAGYISTESLIYCNETTAASVGFSTPLIPSGELCREVEPRVAPQGLAIRADASSSSAYVGGVDPGGRVTLVPNFTVIRDRNGSGREWVEISAPQRGFVSAGNLIMCR